MTTGKKIALWIALALLLAAGLFVYFKFYFVFGDGVKAGELNQFTYKGYVWKTYEGKIIQAGFKGSAPRPAVQPPSSHTFLISPSLTRKLPTN